MSSDVPNNTVLEPGAILDGRYEILDLLNQGGYAVLYRARQLNIDRVVAIKVLKVHRDEHDNTVIHQRFIREAKATARIDHPAVVTVHDFGLVDGTMAPYMVMELLDGHDLAQELDLKGALPPVRALSLGRRFLEGLAEAHKQGIVHKDLKPSNLFLTHPDTDNEGVRIVDFGIAHISDGVRLTLSGHVSGTPRYMAPEYIRNRDASPAVDVYQMGLILCEMLTGKPMVPFVDAARCFQAHLGDEVKVPEHLCGGPLERILTTALATEPLDRYADASEFLEALVCVQADTVTSMASLRARPHRSQNRPSEELTPDGAMTTRGAASSALDTPARLDSQRVPVAVHAQNGQVRAAALTSPAAVSSATAPVQYEETGLRALPANEDRRRRARTMTVAVAIGLLVAAVGFVVFWIVASDPLPEGSFVRIEAQALGTDHSLWVQPTEVTQTQWKRLMGNNPSAFSDCGGQCPVERVSWWDALAFSNRLSERHGFEACYALMECKGKAGEDLECGGVQSRAQACSGYRLPNEEEWRALAKLEQALDRHSEVAWLKGGASNRPHAVASLTPDDQGVHDLLGNVWEWVWTQSNDKRRYVGCSWRVAPDRCRTENHSEARPGHRVPDLGFRLVRTVR